MHELSLYLLISLLGSFVGGVLVLLVAFVLWVFTLRSELQVYAPLVDAPRWVERPRRAEKPRQSNPSRRPSTSHFQAS